MISEYDNGVVRVVVEDRGRGMREEEEKEGLGGFEGV